MVYHLEKKRLAATKIENFNCLESLELAILKALFHGLSSLVMAKNHLILQR
jgi:hypothetical protein